jgi:serine/threonine protein phosphatase PrpC
VSIAFKFFPYSGEKVLLCTDGLYNQIPPAAIHQIISTDERADQKVMSLISEANHAGGSDNEGVAYFETLPNL